MTVGDFLVGEILRALGSPALVIHAADDHSVPLGEAESITAACPTARLLRADGLDHRKVPFAPEIVTAVTDFLLNPA